MGSSEGGLKVFKNHSWALRQGFIVAEELGDVYLARVLEAWLGAEGLKEEQGNPAAMQSVWEQR